jgi:hypothetical protein
MKRLRSLFGGGDEPRPGAMPPDDAVEPAEDEAARELRLQREFYTGLSEVARHELRFQDYAPEAPSQFNRTGRWITAEATDASDESRRAIVLEPQTELDYESAVAEGDSGPMFRFRTAEGRPVDVAAPDGEAWPPSIVRPSDLRQPGDG